MKDAEIDQMIGSAPVPPLALERVKQIEASIQADLKPVRPLAPAGVYFAGFAGVFAAACLLSLNLMPGQQGWDALSKVQRLLVFVPLIAAVGLLALSTIRQMTPAARHTQSAAAAGASVFALLIGAIALLFHPAHESAFVKMGLVCFRNGMVFAIPTALLTAVILRRGAGLSPALTGATTGGLAGLAGLAVLEIHCPNLNLFHILAWHVSVVLVCAAAGFVLGSVAVRLAHVSR